jgi:hypothetical protein
MIDATCLMTVSRFKVLWLRIVGRIAYYEIISNVFAYHIQIEHNGTEILAPHNSAMMWKLCQLTVWLGLCSPDVSMSFPARLKYFPSTCFPTSSKPFSVAFPNEVTGVKRLAYDNISSHILCTKSTGSIGCRVLKNKTHCKSK